MDALTFAAERGARLEQSDKELASIVADALAAFGAGDWYEPIVEGASVLWLEMFEKQAPKGRKSAMRMAGFQKQLRAALSKTTEPEDPVSQGQIDRIAYWVSTYATNNATYSANAAGGNFDKRWVSMEDESVRPTHREADGQTVPNNARFTVGEVQMRYPGEPIGDPSNWINCRCLMMPVEKGAKVADEETVVAAATEEPVKLLDNPEAEGSEDEAEVDEPVEIPFHGIAAPIGKPSEEKQKRQFNELTWRQLPQPLKYQPADLPEHGATIRVGTIKKMWIDEEDNLRYSGVFAANVPEVSDVIDGIVEGYIGGVSVEISDYTMAIGDRKVYETEEEMIEAMQNPAPQVMEVGNVSGLAVVATPAFVEAYIALGEEDCTECDEGHEGSDEVVEEEVEEETIAASAETFAPGTKDGPGWLTNPDDTARLRRYWTKGKGAAKIKWGLGGDFNRCRRQLAKYITNPTWLAGACSNMHKEVLGFHPGPGKRHSAITASAQENMAPAWTIIAAATVSETLPSYWFEDPKFDGPTQLTVTDEGRVYGHVAVWDACHVGISDRCVLPPRSVTDYAYFHTGRVQTDNGEYVSVGHFTIGIGHADPYLSPARATAHYDKSDSVVCDVTVGEDRYGIWYSGALRESVTPERRRELQATGCISGDWRYMANANNRELIAAVVVGTPGFPIPATRYAAAGDLQLSLTASGIVTHDMTATDPVEDLVRQTADQVMIRLARRQRLAAVREKSYAVIRPELIKKVKRI